VASEGGLPEMTGQASQVPYRHCVIVTAGYQASSVRAPGHCIDSARVTGESGFLNGVG
jgi:hypothetical protein